ncbi:MAG: tetratricopeptide repeat protein [Planctomycetota bacterium]
MSTARELYREAIKLFRGAKLPEAIAKLSAAIALEPQFHDAYEALGEMYARAGRLDEAIAITQKFCELAPDEIMAHTNLSRFYQKKGMVAEAEAEQGKARLLAWKAELKQGAPPGGNLVAPAQTGTPETVMLTPGAAASAPTVPPALQPKSDTFRRMVELNPDDPLARYSLGRALADELQHAAAVSELERLLERKPDYSVAYLQLGKSLEALGRRDAAIEVYRRGIAVAGGKGDLMPKKEMERKLLALTQPSA